jgi:uncharacterized protein (DUF2235 family)
MMRWGGTVGVARNIVICCDGTGNEIIGKSYLASNVLKLFRIVRKNDNQIVFYHPGVGTISSSDEWSRLKSDALGVWGHLTGYGLDENVLEAYRFLLDTYEDGDRIYMFGFSRGAYTVRLLGGFLWFVGLLGRPQRNLCEYALTAYKRAAELDEFEIAWLFGRDTAARRVPIAFMGVWDTVSSVIVPRPDRLYLPSLQELPYTRTNPSIEVFRHAIAIDERRRMFRINHWTEPQIYKPNPFSTEAAAQDIKQVWFAGVHSDIGGGYSETESGAAKYPLRWMIDEAVVHGLEIRKSMYNHLVLGYPLPRGRHTYTAPDFTAKIHNSMNWAWSLLEGIPKRTTRRDWLQRQSVLGWYLPLCEPRRIDDRALVHHSVLDRVNADPNYRPVNLPPIDRIHIEGSATTSLSEPLRPSLVTG